MENIVTSSNDDRQFGEHFLADILYWIRDYFAPEDIYTEEQLIMWVESKEPDDIFAYAELTAWAVRNGFKHE